MYRLNVRTWSRSNSAPPIDRELPPWYLPQAIGHLLPRLVPLNEPRTFLFGSFVREKQEVMSRYVDVERARNVVFDGKTILVVPIKDRIGMEGSPTYHYLTPAGTYVGSENEEARIVILPADEATLRRLWPDADLRAPSPVADLPAALRSEQLPPMR
jgi:hypothetical protein